MFEVDQTLLIRALNSTRQAYFPTYVGLRLIGSQLSFGKNDYLQKLICRRLIAGDTWRFKPFKLYKGSIQTPQGLEHQYRNCLASSPLTAIAESFILKMLAESPAFGIAPRAYSYRWPLSSRSGTSYRYFFDGYKQRNIEIAAALSTPNQVAVVTDLKNFYPSAEKSQVESFLASRLGQSEKHLKELGEAILGFYSQLLAASEKGIPICPASGHVLGHLILQDVDNELTSKFGHKYFRYVDDIVVICHETDAEAVKRDIHNSIERQGFSINPDKTSKITGAEWHHNILHTDISDKDSLTLLSRDLAAYLVFHPNRADELKRMFADAGLRIPIGRLLALSKYNRFRFFISHKKTVGLVFSNNNEFLQRGLSLKGVYERSLSELIGAPAETSPNLQRWQLQRVRRVINSLFYLRSFDEWGDKSGTFEAFPDLVEQQALAKALSSGIVNPILPFYGSAPAAFSELWAEHSQGNAIFLLPLQTGITPTEVDALITLRLYGIISADSMQFLTNNKELRLAGIVNQETSVRTTPDLSFEDEFESLCLGTTDQEISELVRTRYSFSEGAVLEALSLLSSEYRS